jgi:hypothetical protein
MCLYSLLLPGSSSYFLFGPYITPSTKFRLNAGAYSFCVCFSFPFAFVRMDFILLYSGFFSIFLQFILLFLFCFTFFPSLSLSLSSVYHKNVCSLSSFCSCSPQFFYSPCFPLCRILINKKISRDNCITESQISVTFGNGRLSATFLPSLIPDKPIELARLVTGNCIDGCENNERALLFSQRLLFTNCWTLFFPN